MPIYYRVIPLRHPRTGERIERPVIVRHARADGRAFVRNACDETTIGVADALGTLTRLGSVMARELRDGHPVRIPEVGLFHVTLLYDPAPPGKFHPAKHLKGVRVRFRPDPALVQALHRPDYRKLRPTRTRGKQAGKG